MALREAAGDALDENFGIWFNEDRHGEIYDFGFTIYDFNSKQIFLLRAFFFNGLEQPYGVQIFFASDG